MIVTWVAGTHLTVPVERESYLVELFAIVIYVVCCSLLRMLSGLYGILLGWKSVGIISHRVQNVEPSQPLVPRINVGSYVSERMSYVQSGAGRVGEHVEDIVFLLRLVLCYLVGLVVNPGFLPFLFNFSEIVIHCLSSIFILIFLLKDV